MDVKISGSCCCGAVTFELIDNFNQFYFCHCEQCRKLTGSAHASNLFTAPDNIKWLTGKDKIKHYEEPDRPCFKAFCMNCGSALPMHHKSGKFLVIPAGSLDREPNKSVDAHIFIEEQTEWCKLGENAKRVKNFPF